MSTQPIKITPFGKRLLENLKARIRLHPEKTEMGHWYGRLELRDDPYVEGFCDTTSCMAGHLTWMTGTQNKRDVVARFLSDIDLDQATIPESTKDVLSKRFPLGKRAYILPGDIAAILLTDDPRVILTRLWYVDNWPENFRNSYYRTPNPKDRAEIICQRIDYFLETGL